MEEIWKECTVNNNYEVSNKGRVRNKKTGKILKHKDNGHGYKHVSFYYGSNGRKYYVHRLVALAFIPSTLNKEVVNHIDGNKSNNCINNLEWCTQSENLKHAYKIGLNKRTEEQIRVARERLIKINSDPEKRALITKKLIEANSMKSSREYMMNSSNQFKPLKCIELNRIFLNARRVEEKLGIKRSAIHKWITKKWQTCGGYHWVLLKKHRFNNYGRPS